MQDVDIFYTLIFHRIREALPLHTGHIEYIGLVDDLLREHGVLVKRNVVRPTKLLLLLRHRELAGRNEVERGVEVRQADNQRVDRTTILQVAHHRHGQVVQPPLRFLDRVEIEQRLRGVLVGAVASVDQGHIRHLRGVAHGPL